MEIWEILDENRCKTGRTVVRGQPMAPGDFHLVVFAIIKNSKDEIIISKRAPNKTFPSTWEVTGGSAVLGEDSYLAVTREVKEELGIDLVSKGTLLESYMHIGEFSHFSDVWLFEEDVDLSQAICQQEEVSDVRWVNKAELYDLFEKNMFMVGVPYMIRSFELFSF